MSTYSNAASLKSIITVSDKILPDPRTDPTPLMNPEQRAVLWLYGDENINLFFTVLDVCCLLYMAFGLQP